MKKNIQIHFKYRIIGYLKRFARGEKVSSRTSMYAPVLSPFKSLYLTYSPIFEEKFELIGYLKRFAQVESVLTYFYVRSGTFAFQITLSKTIY